MKLEVGLLWDWFVYGSVYVLYDIRVRSLGPSILPFEHADGARRWS